MRSSYVPQPRIAPRSLAWPSFVCESPSHWRTARRGSTRHPLNAVEGGILEGKVSTMLNTYDHICHRQTRNGGEHRSRERAHLAHVPINMTLNTATHEKIDR